MNSKLIAMLSLSLLLAAAPTKAYMQPPRPIQLERPKWETFEVEKRHQVTQPPLAEKRLWERALARQERESLKQSPPSSQEAPIVWKKKSKKSSSWERVSELAAVGGITEGKILTVNRGGAICNVHGVKAFLPNSHLGEHPSIGKTLPIKVVQADDDTKMVLVSNREANRENLRKGDIVHGVVTSFQPYGAFVSFGGGLQGLLHKHNISVNDWKLVRHEQGYKVDECFRNDWETDKVLLEKGSQVKCLVTSHNRDNGRIALSTKALEPEPGDMLRDPQMVFAKAEMMAAAHRDRRAQELLEYEILASICEDNSLSPLFNNLLP